MSQIQSMAKRQGERVCMVLMKETPYGLQTYGVSLLGLAVAFGLQVLVDALMGAGGAVQGCGGFFSQVAQVGADTGINASTSADAEDELKQELSGQIHAG